ncbi:hypothetical protein [Desulfosarcina cetonica]|uniref:hypothetical protein n=1 Tax=Desulfosarcina cetonica TaxID=90730 RepID=UPI0012EE9E6F|nr:hypothetical protein [Desulfosarcina cetonica]
MTQRPHLRMKFGLKLFFSHFLAVILVSGSIGTFFYFNAVKSLVQSLQSRLKNSAALLSQSIDAKALDGIRSAADTENPIYRRTLNALRRMRRSNPDIAFLYIMRHEQGRITFVVDSDETDQQALPGREYTEAPELLLSGFTEPAVDDRLSR